MVPSSQDSSSAQSGSDSQNPSAELEKDARVALHNMEIATGIHVSQKHRSAMVEHSLALGKRETLENFRQACYYWRRQHAQGRAVEGSAAPPQSALLYDRGTTRHLALDQFSRAYHAAQTTIVHRAVLDVLYRADLAHLHDVYVQTLEALSRLAVQEKATLRSRPRDLFDSEVRSAAMDQMYWACYPDLQGKPRSCNKGLSRKFGTTLEHAEKWHALREEFGIGIFALVPRGANTWFEKLPFKDLPVYFGLVAAVNPAAANMAEMITERVLSLWRREAPPEQRLRLEHLDTVNEIAFKANPSELLEEVNVGYTTSRARLEGDRTGRAVTLPAGVDENHLAALDAAFSTGIGISQGGDEYPLSSSFYEGVDF